jgi:urea transporter/murein DD-endopeptidase MepM/ murein hydrolase activator NlpD
VQKILPIAKALLNSYSVLFFSNNKLFAVLLLLVSFFNPYAGLTGMLSVLLAVLLSYSTGLNRASINKGIYSYNALIIGIGMGSIYNFSGAFWLLLTTVVIFSVILSVIFENRLGKYGLPFLTLPFVLCFWAVMLVTKDFAAIDFSFRNIYWLNDAYAIGDQKLVRFIMFMEKLDMPPLVATFFRALSSLYFQNNILAGLIIAAGILIHSRIIFSLIIVGFLAAYGFNSIVMAHPEGMNYYLTGGNFILVSVAVGGFFVVPSIHSYFWAIISVPITFIIVMGLGRITGQWSLPVFSMPFCITVLSLLYFFSLKAQKGKLVLTTQQLYSPEKNLYNHLNNKERLQNAHHIRLQLPFIGEWMVSQGYDGSITHKGDWSKALDFIIVDNELKTYDQYAATPDNFYCFGKPVLAAADGYVQQIEDDIDDNEIGKINQQQNWGNSIVIKHAENLYTKMSHLRKYSFKVKEGDYVRKGDIVASCGNSGRSPEPHLHFQVQTTPYIGSKTFVYPLAHYVVNQVGKIYVKEFSIPQETEIVYNSTSNPSLQQAFEFLPGANLSVNATGFEEGKWEVFTDAYNQSYIYCHSTKSFAYFKKNEAVFYFISFEGDKKSLLYYFYLACYKIYLSTDPSVKALDKYPLQLTKNTLAKWLQDFVSPFFIFSRLYYESLNKETSADFLNSTISISSKQILQFLSFRNITNEFEIIIADNRITSFTFLKKHQSIKAVCVAKEY